MSSNLKVNKRSQKSFSVTRFSGFDGSRVQITTARDHRKEISVSDQFFNSVNLNKQEAMDLVETLMGFINGTDNECYDSVPLVEAKKQWMDDFNKVRPGTSRIVKRDNGDVVVERPTFSKLLQENQEKLSQNDLNYFNSRRMA
jgi:endo-1,4-beta-D-glucanase Y